MEYGRSFEGINHFFEKVMHLAYVNFLWILFAVTGGVVFGFFPATIAMFSVMRKWIKDKDEGEIFRYFFKQYKSSFIKANILGYLLLITGYLLYVEIEMAAALAADYSIFPFVYYPLITLNITFLLMLMYVFPIFVHYELNLFQVIKYSFQVMFANPVITIVVTVGAIVIYYIMITFPFLALFFGGSLLAYFIMFTSYQAFPSVENN